MLTDDMPSSSTVKSEREEGSMDVPQERVTATHDEDGVDFLESGPDTGEEDFEATKKEDAMQDAFKARLRSYAYSLSSPSPEKNTKKTIDIPKRPSSSSLTQSPRTSPSKRPRTTSKPTTLSRSATRALNRSLDPHNPPSNLTDALRPSLHLLMIGLNPGLLTASTGHAYAHPSNHFWRLLHSSGLTSIRHPPSDTHALMDLYGIGNTNLCPRPTRDGSGLSKSEMEDGVGVLDEKVRRYKPEVVCIVGKGIWDTIARVKLRQQGKPQGKEKQNNNKNKNNKPFKYGWVEDETLWLARTMTIVPNDSDNPENDDNDDDGDGRKTEYRGARTFVATTTSGLAAGMKTWEKEEIWKVLGDWIVEDRKRRERLVEMKTEGAKRTVKRI